MIQGHGAVKGLQGVGHMLLTFASLYLPLRISPTLTHLPGSHISNIIWASSRCPYSPVFPVETSLTTNWIMKQRLYKFNWDFNRPGKDLSRGDKSVLNIVERAHLWKLLTHALWILQLMRFMYLYLLKAYLPVFNRILSLLPINLPSRF